VCLIKQKLKTKHYQYLYLQEKLTSREDALLNTDYDNNEYYYQKESKRLDCLSSWLDKINKKYNYA
tara:strand:+ start:297 stop:494 length:198 start_codon:yes stop_codon:yes gene_type:complete